MRRILSIDGGGIKGIFPASFLATIEETIGDNIANYFDLIAGTSTGGILALGLGLGFSAQELVSFYEDLGPRVFSNRVSKIANLFWRPKYDQEPLKKALQEKFADKKLGESKVRLVIPALNFQTGEVYVYKTVHDPRFERDYLKSAVDVALATAAAPTYFPTHRTGTGLPLIDGGIWANNPTLSAAIEAVGVLGWAPQETQILSLSCTESPLDLERGKDNKMGQLYFADKLADLFMCAQSSSALGMTKLLVTESNLIRVTVSVPGHRFGLDSIDKILTLKGLGESEARKFLPRIKTMFFSNRAEVFIPFRELRAG